LRNQLSVGRVNSIRVDFEPATILGGNRTADNLINARFAKTPPNKGFREEESR